MDGIASDLGDYAIGEDVVGFRIRLLVSHNQTDLKVGEKNRLIVSVADVSRHNIFSLSLNGLSSVIDHVADSVYVFEFRRRITTPKNFIRNIMKYNNMSATKCN
jgi:hypothetical protein